MTTKKQPICIGRLQFQFNYLFLNIKYSYSKEGSLLAFILGSILLLEIYR